MNMQQITHIMYKLFAKIVPKKYRPIGNVLYLSSTNSPNVVNPVIKCIKWIKINNVSVSIVVGSGSGLSSNSKFVN